MNIFFYFRNGGTAVTDGRFGRGTGPIWLDDVECQGNELHIEQCISRPWNESNCDHSEDVGVICNVSPVQSSSVSPATTRAPATVQPSNCKYAYMYIKDVYEESKY